MYDVLHTFFFSVVSISIVCSRCTAIDRNYLVLLDIEWEISRILCVYSVFELCINAVAFPGMLLLSLHLYTKLFY